jgi:hypothetical protein
LSKMRYLRLISALTLVLLISAVVLLHRLLNLPLEQLLPVTAGASMYLLHVVINKSERLFHADYIQTGEGMISVLAIYLTMQFISQNWFLITSITFISILIFQFIIKNIVDSSKEDAFIYGIVINTIILSSMGIMALSHSGFDSTLVFQILFGILPDLFLNNPFYITIFIISLILLLLIWKASSDFFLFSHGKNYSMNMKVNYRYFAVIITIIRSFSLLLTVACIGFLGCGGYYLFRGKKASGHVFLTVLLFLFTVKALEPYVDKMYILIAIFAVSYILMVLHRRRRTVIYDRN